MQIKKRPLIFAVLFWFLANAFAAEPTKVPIKDKDLGGGIIYGDDHALIVVAPKGWILDNKSGVKSGLHAVFYPEGGSWSSSSSVMYVNVAHKSIKGNESLENLIKTDSENFKNKNPNIKITTAGAIEFGKTRAIVKKFEGDRYGNSEAVAYIDEAKAIVMIILSSRNSSEFKKYYAKFEDLVKSYVFIGSDVRLDGKKLSSPGKNK